jgi:hypothetical protein
MVVLGADLDVVVPPLNIQSCEQHFALELFEYMGDLWYGIDIPDHPLVDFSVVLYWSEQAILLFNEEEGG